MDFQQLLARMQELDSPATENITDEGGCGMDSPGPIPTPTTPPSPPPSMSVNLNAQGMDNIEDLMKLITKVNPEMDKPSMPPLPMMSPEPKIMSIKPSMPPLKMLPDFDAENDDMPGGEKDIQIKALDKDDQPEDDEKDDEKKDKEEALANSPAGSQNEPEVKDFDSAVPSGDDLHKQKSMHKAAAGGDNPMAAESTDLRAKIRAELLQRLAEAKQK